MSTSNPRKNLSHQITLKFLLRNLQSQIKSRWWGVVQKVSHIHKYSRCQYCEKWCVKQTIQTLIILPPQYQPLSNIFLYILLFLPYFSNSFQGCYSIMLRHLHFLLPVVPNWNGTTSLWYARDMSSWKHKNQQ